MRRAKIIYNPVAGSARGEQMAALAEAKLKDSGWSVDCEATSGRSGAAKLASELGDDVELLVVAGGDGSIREAIAGLGERRKHVTLAILPMGNANVVARELGIPRDPRDAVELLPGDAIRQIDVCRVHMSEGGEAEYCLAMVGLGWDALVVHYIDRIRHTRLGRFLYRLWADGIYIFCGLLATLHFRPPRFRVRIDGSERPGTSCGTHFCNFHSYGKGMSMAPQARCDSGRMHVQLRHASHVPALLGHLIAAQLRREAPAFISSYCSARTAAVESERGVPVQIDGDFKGWAKDLRIEILPGAARFRVGQRLQ